MKSHHQHREYHKIIPAVQVILQRQDGKILMMRRANTGFDDGMYGFAAGHLESHETPRETGVREAKEEAGVEIDINDMEFVHIIHRLNLEDHSDHQERIEWAFVCHKWQGEPKIMEPDKCNDIGWYALTQLPENTQRHVRQIIDCWQKGIYYSEHKHP